MGIEALLSTQIIDTTAVGRAVMTAADAAAARTAIGAGTSSFSGAYSALSGIPSTFAPSAHKTSHATGGSDALTAADIGAAATGHTHAAADITSGTIATARLASGTADATTYLRGDQTWQTIAAGGISSLNTLTDATQTFATGTTGTDFAISSAAGVHTFNMPSASATARGVVTTGTQTFAGVKTFSSKITAPATGSAITGGIGNGFNGVNFYQGVMVYIVGNGSSIRYPFYFSLSTTASSIPHFKLASDAVIGWSNATDATTSTAPGATQIARWADYHVTIRNSTSACSFSVVNTYTSGTSFERLLIGWSGNVCTIECDKGSAGGTLRGLRIGGSSSALVGLWGATPIEQPTTAVAAATRVGGGGTTVTDSDTFDGYTISQIVKALRNIGALA